MNYTFESGYIAFENSLNQIFNAINLPSFRLGIACSGGPDSILILHYIFKYNAKFPEKINFLMVIHIIDGHFLIEPQLKKSMEEARQLVIKLANSMMIKFIVYNNTDVSLFSQKISIEALCHQMRKNFFNQARVDYSLDRIIMGHNLTDQIEHYFIGVIRRASLERISGMKEDSGIYLRPFLSIKKSNVMSILDAEKKEYVLDPCNNNLGYLRNIVRKKMLPQLPLIDQRFEGSIIHHMNQLSQLMKVIDYYLSLELKKEQFYNINYFLTLPLFIQYKIIEKKLYQVKYKKVVSIKFCDEVIRFLSFGKKNYYNINNIKIVKENKNWNIVK